MRRLTASVPGTVARVATSEYAPNAIGGQSTTGQACLGWARDSPSPRHATRLSPPGARFLRAKNEHPARSIYRVVERAQPAARLTTGLGRSEPRQVWSGPANTRVGEPLKGETPNMQTPNAQNEAIWKCHFTRPKPRPPFDYFIPPTSTTLHVSQWMRQAVSDRSNRRQASYCRVCRHRR